MLFVMVLLLLVVEWGIGFFLMATLIVCAPGILMTVIGIVLRKSRLKKAMEGYAKATGFTMDELHQFDQEFWSPNTILFSLVGSVKANLKNCGIITEHYIKMPSAFAFIYRIEDMVACYFSKILPDEYSSYATGFIAYTSEENRAFEASVTVKEKDAQEVVNLILSRNPSIFGAHHFMYDGKQYDAYLGRQEVIALHNRLLGRS